MHKFDIIIEENIPNLETQCLKNSFIMKNLLKSGYEGEDLTELNRCRMQPNTTCLSYSINGDGKSLSVHYLEFI